jgi:hypothetical protein
MNSHLDKEGKNEGIKVDTERSLQQRLRRETVSVSEPRQRKILRSNATLTASSNQHEGIHGQCVRR